MTVRVLEQEKQCNEVKSESNLKMQRIEEWPPSPQSNGVLMGNELIPIKENRVTT
jgi:hypothetical protein